MKLQVDKSRRDVEFQVGQQVLLSTKYMRKQMSSGNKTVVPWYIPKLLPRYIGPFRGHRQGWISGLLPGSQGVASSPSVPCVSAETVQTWWHIPTTHAL